MILHKHVSVLTSRHRASVIADEIEEKANANSESLTGLAAVEEKIMTKTPNEKISILENDGRVVISTNNGVGDFSLRTDLSSLGYYYVKNGGISAANQLQWYAYYQDADGNAPAPEIVSEIPLRHTQTQTLHYHRRPYRRGWVRIRRGSLP